MSTKKSKDNYEVGFGKPPKKNQFKEGVSGNPTGRPKKPVDFDQQLLREASTPVFISENGQRIRTTKNGALIKVLMQEALKGKMNAIRLLLAHYRQAFENDALSKERRAKDAEPLEGLTARDLSDEMLAKIIFDSLEAEKRLAEGEQGQAAKSTEPPEGEAVTPPEDPE